MKARLLLYTRKDCCLCEEMKSTLLAVSTRVQFTLEEIDVDAAPALREKYGNDVPLLLINGRKAFKYRLTARELERRLRRESGSVSG